MLYVRLLQYNKFYGEYDMGKKVVMWAVIVPMRIVEWMLWPVAKAHSWLRKYCDKLCDKTSFI